MPAGEVTVRLNLNKDGYSAGMTAARKEAQVLEKAVGDAGHGTVSSMQAASAAIRVLEGGMTGNIRAAERFIGTIPGVGKALQAIFPLVGSIAVGGIFVKMGEELAKFIEATNKVPQAIEQAFQSLHTASSITNDDLQISTDKLRNQLALLEHKPVNMAALALHETWLEADKLTKSLEESDKALQSLMKENQITAMGAVLTGKTGTANVSGSLQSYHDQESDLGYRHGQAVRSGDSAGAASLMKELGDKIASEHEYTQRTIAGFRAGQGFGDPTANIKLLEGDDQNITDTKDTAKNTKDNKDAQLALDAETKKQEAARKAAEAAKKASEAQIDQWRKSLDALKAVQEMTLNQDASFWIGRAAMARNGSLEYRTAVDEGNKAMAAQQGENLRQATQFNKMASRAGGVDDLGRDLGPEKEQGRDVTDWLKNLNQGISLSHENADAMEEASLKMAEATGQISKLDAAQLQAALHTKLYTAAMDDLQEALANAAKLPGGFARNSAMTALQNQGTAWSGERAVQSKQDQQDISDQQVGHVLGVGVNQMVAAWTDASQQVVGLFQNSVNSFNSTLVNVMTSRNRQHQIPREFEAMGHSMFTDATSRSLQAGEGMIGKALGFGGKKPDGSAGNPLHVIMAGGSAIAGAASSAASKAGGFLGSIGKFIQPFFQGAFAEGGNFVANRPMLVGDKGPEILMPGNSGSIIPNHQINGGTTHSISIDARGSTDPAATEAAIHRAMGQYLPAAVGASVGAVKEQGRRVPLSHR
jgi:hypothetical protein